MLFGRGSILILLSLLSCKSVVQKYDQRLVKKYHKAGFTEKRISKNGVDIFYFDNEKKDAPLLYLVHGFGGDAKLNWQNQIDRFSESYRIIMHDLLWFGKSTANREPSLEEQIVALDLLMDATSNGEKAHLAGISYGGFIVLGDALQHQEKLATLNIIDSPGSTISDEEIEAFCKEIGAKDVKEAFVLNSGEDVKRLLQFSFYKPPKLPGFVLRQVQDVYFSKHHEEQKKLLDDLPENRKKFNNLSSLHIPVAVYWGEEDQVFSLQNGKDLANRLGATFFSFPKAGHALPEDAKKEFNDSLFNFLQKNN